MRLTPVQAQQRLRQCLHGSGRERPGAQRCLLSLGVPLAQ